MAEVTPEPTAATPPVEIEPAKVAAELLKKALPAFETRIDGDRDRLTIHGALPIRLAADLQPLTYLVPHSENLSTLEVRIARNVRDALESDEARKIREARERAEERRRVEEAVAPFVEHLAGNIRRFAIEAVNLEPEIAARIERARNAARDQALAEGVERGRREGRAELLREWHDAIDVTEGGRA